MFIIMVMLILILQLYARTYLGVISVEVQYKKPYEITEPYVKEWINEVEDKEGDFFLAKSKIEGKEIYYLYVKPCSLNMDSDKQNIYIKVEIKRNVNNPEDTRIFIIKPKNRKVRTIVINGEVIPTKSIREICVNE